MEPQSLLGVMDMNGYCRIPKELESFYRVEVSDVDSVNERIQELIHSTSELPRAVELADCLNRLMVGSSRSNGPSTATAITQLPDECQRDIIMWLCLWERLRQLDPVLAKKLKHTRRNSRTAGNRTATRSSLCNRVREALSRVLSGTTRKEIESTVSKLDQIELRILKRMNLLLPP